MCVDPWKTVYVCQAVGHAIRKGIEKGKEADEKGGDLCLPGHCYSDPKWLRKEIQKPT